jgi:hypothetical protein
MLPKPFARDVPGMLSNCPNFIVKVFQGRAGTPSAVTMINSASHFFEFNRYRFEGEES